MCDLWQTRAKPKFIIWCYDTREGGRGSRTRTHLLYVTGKPEIHKLLFLSYNDHYSVFFSVMKWFLWFSISPSISKHPASRTWKTTYPSPERMISSHIPLLISFVSRIPPRFKVPSRIPPNLCWTLVKKIRQKFRFNSISNFSPAIRRRNKVFWFPGLIFSTTPSLFKRELPENARFRCQFHTLHPPPRSSPAPLLLTFNAYEPENRLQYIEDLRLAGTLW